MFSLPTTAAFAGDDDAQKKIPIDTQPVAATSPVVVDHSEDNNRAFNTPTDGGRPGECYFALGVQAVNKHDYVHVIAM